jgi:superoxide dismutase
MYVNDWWYVVNWDQVSQNCAYVLENGKGISF